MLQIKEHPGARASIAFVHEHRAAAQEIAVSFVREIQYRVQQWVAGADERRHGLAEARDKLVGKKRTAAETAAALAALVEEALEPLLEWDAARLEATLRGFAERAGWKPGDLFMPVRVAVTGRTATPPLFETTEVLGREVCRRRLRRAVEVLREIAGVATVETGPEEEASDDGGE